MRNTILNKGIPISLSLNPTLEAENIRPQIPPDKKRLLTMAALAVFIAFCISLIANRNLNKAQKYFYRHL